MSLDFAGAEFSNDPGSGIAPNPDPLSSLPILPSSSILSETLQLGRPEYAGTPLTFPVLALTEEPFDWEESFVMTNDGITPTQAIQDPSAFFAQEWFQQYTTHPPAKLPSEDGSSFVMTCPLPLCSHQSSELISIWRHITWDHLGDTNKCSKAMTELVEKVVLGTGEQQ